MPSKKIILLIILIALLLAIVAGIGFFYYCYFKNASLCSIFKKGTMEERYPDVISGIISFSEDKIVLKTNKNKEYRLWPPAGKDYYEKKGLKDGQKIEVRGKILEGGRFYVASIKPR